MSNALSGIHPGCCPTFTAVPVLSSFFLLCQHNRTFKQTRHRQYLQLGHHMCKERMSLPKVGSSLFLSARIPRNLVHGYTKFPAHNSWCPVWNDLRYPVYFVLLRVADCSHVDILWQSHAFMNFLVRCEMFRTSSHLFNGRYTDSSVDGVVGAG